MADGRDAVTILTSIDLKYTHRKARYGSVSSYNLRQRLPSTCSSAWEESRFAYMSNAPIPASPARSVRSQNSKRSSHASRRSRNGQAPPAWPATLQDWQTLRHSFASSPGKNYGGTRGDSALINWTLAIAETVSAAVVTGYSYEFLTSYGRYNGSSSQNFTHAYYSCQFILGLSILTFILLAVYVLWVFADSASLYTAVGDRAQDYNADVVQFLGRHPMRKAWLFTSEKRNGHVLSAQGKPVKWPGLGTTSFDKVNRMTTHRLYAERAHISKMLGLYAILFVAVRAVYWVIRRLWTDSQRAVVCSLHDVSLPCYLCIPDADSHRMWAVNGTLAYSMTLASKFCENTGRFLGERGQMLIVRLWTKLPKTVTLPIDETRRTSMSTLQKYAVFARPEIYVGY